MSISPNGIIRYSPKACLILFDIQIAYDIMRIGQYEVTFPELRNTKVLTGVIVVLSATVGFLLLKPVLFESQTLSKTEYQEQIIELRKSINSERDKNNSLSDELSSNSKNRSRLLNEVMSLNETIRNDRGQLSEAKYKLNKYMDSLNDMEQTYNHMLNQYNGMNSKIDSLEKIAFKYENQEWVKKSDLVAIEQEIIKIKKENEEQRKLISVLEHFYGDFLVAERISDAKIKVDFKLSGIDFIKNSKYAPNNKLRLYVRIKDLATQNYVVHLERTNPNDRDYALVTFDVSDNQETLAGTIDFVNTDLKPFAKKANFRIELYAEGIKRPLKTSHQTMGAKLNTFQ